jgi:hypothetical protein
MRKAGLLILTCWCAVSSSVCGARVPQPVGAPRGVPHISWVVMAGDSDNPDAQFVCQSDPRTDCVFTASRPGAQVWSSLYLYYHGVGEEIRYAGSIQIGFFEGPPTEAHEVRPNIIVKGNEIIHQSVVDDVTATPGTYSMTFDVVATTATGKLQPIRDAVRVVVK